MSENAFDAVVIGSGLGGLTAAALLAKAGRKVCVIERNHSVGGAASVFKKGELTIEPSLHQTADPRDPTEPKHAILTELGLLDEIEWVPVTPFYSVQRRPRRRGVRPAGRLRRRARGAEPAVPEEPRRARRGSSATIERIADARQRADRGAASSARSASSRAAAIDAARPRARLARLDRRHARRGCFGADEAAKFAVAGNIGYYADDARRSRLAVLRRRAGRLSQVGRRLHQGRLARAHDEARQGRDDARAARSCSAARRSASISTRPAARPPCAMSTPRAEATSSASRRGRCSPIARRTCWRRCCPTPSAAKIEAAYGGAAAVDLAVLRPFRAEPAAGEIRPRPLRRRCVMPDWMKSLDDLRRRARASSRADPGGRNAGLRHRQLRRDRQRARRRRPDAGHRWSGVDRLDNWAALSPQDEKDRRERWLDAFQAALDRRLSRASARR